MWLYKKKQNMDQRSIFMDGVKNRGGRRRPDLNNQIMAGMQGIGGYPGTPPSWK